MINQSIKFFTIFLLVFNVFAGGDDRDEGYYENLDEEQKEVFFYSISKIYFDVGDDDLAFKYLNLANKLKLTKGSRVSIMMPNLLQYPICTFGILKAGLIVENINPLYTARELETQLINSKSETIIILENFAHLIEKKQI